MSQRLSVVPELTIEDRTAPTDGGNPAPAHAPDDGSPDDDWWRAVLNDDTSSSPDGDRAIDPSFQPVDLGPVLAGNHHQPEPTILARDDRQCLFYEGMLNGVHGDSGVGKGWLLLTAVNEQLANGHNVMLVDTEDTAGSIVARLRLLGATDNDIGRLIYLRPQTEFTTAAVDHLATIVAARGVRLAVLDSLGECFGLDGIDENHDAEVGPWLRRVARRLAEAGPAVVTSDHATKANDNPLHPSGSKRKRAAIGGASYLVTATTPLAAGKGGRLRITCAKDRHGTCARGEHVADLVLTTTTIGGLRAQLYAPDPSDDTELPVMLAARDAVRVSSETGEPLSMRALVGLMTIKASTDTKRAGIELAVTKGSLIEQSGPRNARLFAPVASPMEGGS